MNASSLIAVSDHSNTISSSHPIPSSSLSTINNNSSIPPVQRQQVSTSNTEDVIEQQIPHKTTATSSSTQATSYTSTADNDSTNSNTSLVMVKMNNQVSATQCSNCGTTTTPLWRRAPNGDTICNACGLYLKARHTYRPTTMKRNTQPKKSQPQSCSSTNDSEGLVSGTCPGGGKCNGTGGSSSCAGCPAFNQHQVHRHTSLMCANCRTTTTPLWRRDGDGNTICNACGLYYKLHHVHRPVSMKRSVIKRRKRLMVVAADGGGGSIDASDGDEYDQLDDDEEHHQQQQQQEQERQIRNHGDNQLDETVKKPRKPYRKRVKPQEIDGLGKGKRSRTTASTTANQHSPVSASISSVPAIEDYIVPKRTILPPGSVTGTFSAPVSPSSLISSSVASTSSSSSPSPSSASRSPSLSALVQTDHRQQQQHTSTTTRLTSSMRTDDSSSSSLSLPPISSERRSAQLNPFYHDNRPPITTTTKSSTHSSSSTSSTSLPLFSLPPLRPTTSPALNTGSSPPSIHHPSPLHPTTANRNTVSQPNSSSSAFTSTTSSTTAPTTMNNTDYHADFYRQRQQQPGPEFVELEDWDEALRSLTSLRRKVQPEHVRALAQLSKPLWDMVSKAQSIVHGTGALSQQ